MSLGTELLVKVRQIGRATSDPSAPSHVGDLIAAAIISELTLDERILLAASVDLLERDVCAGAQVIMRALRPKLRVVNEDPDHG